MISKLLHFRRALLVGKGNEGNYNMSVSETNGDIRSNESVKKERTPVFIFGVFHFFKLLTTLRKGS